MANNNVTGPRAASVTSLPVQDDVSGRPDVVPTGITQGHPGTSSLDPKAKAVASTTIAGATQISPNAVKVVGASVTTGAATEAARAESSKLKSVADTAGTAKTIHSMVKKVGVAADGDASTGERMEASAGALKDGLKLAHATTKFTERLSADVVKNMKVAGYGAGAVAGAFNVASNAKELSENLGKAFDGDKKAMADSVNNAAQIMSGTARVVTDVADGAKLLKVAGSAALVTGKTVVGVALRAAPIVGAAIGTVKAGIDMYRDPSIENGLKLAANAIGLIPIPGASAVSMAAAVALENPKVMAAAKGAVQSTGKAFTGFADRVDRMIANAATMEPLGLAM